MKTGGVFTILPLLPRQQSLFDSQTQRRSWIDSSTMYLLLYARLQKPGTALIFSGYITLGYKLAAVTCSTSSSNTPIIASFPLPPPSPCTATTKRISQKHPRKQRVVMIACKRTLLWVPLNAMQQPGPVGTLKRLDTNETSSPSSVRQISWKSPSSVRQISWKSPSSQTDLVEIRLWWGVACALAHPLRWP